MSFKIGKYIVNYLQNNKSETENLSHVDLAKKIIGEDNYINSLYGYRFSSLTKRICEVRSRLTDGLKIKEGKAPKELQTPYKVSNNKYYFSPIKGEFNLPIEVVDDLFHDYSRHGLDLSSTEILLKYNLEPWQWHAVKHALRLYKTSHIFSPYTVENTSPEELKTIIGEKMKQRVDTVGFRVEQEYNKSILKKYKEVINKDALRDLEIKTIINELLDYIPEAEIKPTKLIVKESVDDEISIVITDIHFGVENNSKHLPNYNADVIESMLTQIADEVNSYNAKKVHIFLLGDICETFTGLNHVDSWKGIQSGFYGSQLVINMYKSFIDFISKINNVSSWNQVPGNHDRASASNKEDTEGFIARIVFEFLKLSYKDSDIEFNYDDIIISKRIKNINFLGTHGHLGISKKNPAELILEFGDPSCFNLLMQGHFHERRVKSDHKNFRDIVCPSLMKGNRFSLTSGYSTNSGFLIIKENGKKLPIITDYSL